MLNDIQTPPPDPNDSNDASDKRVRAVRSPGVPTPAGQRPGPDVAAAAIIPGVAGPSPSIRPNEVTRAIDPTAPGSGRVPRNPLVRPHAHVRPHSDPNEPGLHKTRVMGEATHIDPEYAMPMEDRGSAFSLGLSAVVVGVVALVLMIVWFSFFRG